MIIWSRWGFFSFLALGVGVLLGLPLSLALGLDDSAMTPAIVFTLGAGVNALLAFFVYPRLDQPRPVTYTVPLPQPERLPNGQTRTHAVMPALDQNGQQLWSAPTSTLFFIPGRYWWIISLVLAVIFAFVSLFG